jgi:membrane-associated phospholipid phosphatase
LLAGARSGPTLTTALSIGGFLLTGCVLPTLLIICLVRCGRVSALDLRERSERLLPSAVTALGCAAAAWVLARAGASRGIADLALAISIQMALLALLTTRWKVSYHTASASALVLVSRTATTNLVLSLLLLALAVSIGWARVYQRRHTPAQVAVGALTALPIALFT